MPDRDGPARPHPERVRAGYGFLKSHMVTIAVGLAAIVYIYLTHLPDGVLMSPLSSRNVLRLILISAFLLLLIFGHVSKFTLFRTVTTVLVPVSAILVVIYVWLDAPGADGLAREDRLIEDLSFVFLMIGMVAMVAAAIMLYRQRHRLAALAASLLALIFFLIGMEEVSWFQHVFEYDSAAFFRERNSQGETNFHNLYTHESEDIFYLGGFLLLVVFPYFRVTMQGWLRDLNLAALGQLLPPRWLITPFVLAGAFIAAGSISRAANATILIGSSIILIGLLITDVGQRAWWQFGHTLLTLTLFLLTATFFLSFDFEGRAVRPWLGKEYQEFYIAWGIATYAVCVVYELARNSGDHRRSEATQNALSA